MPGKSALSSADKEAVELPKAASHFETGQFYGKKESSALMPKNGG